MTYYALNVNNASGGFPANGTGEGTLDFNNYNNAGSVTDAGITFTEAGFDSWRARNNSVDRRICSLMYVANSASVATLAITLPEGAGTYKVWLGVGDADFASANQKLVIKDGSGGSTLLTVTGSTTAGAKWFDAANAGSVEYNQTDWVARAKGGASESAGAATLVFSGSTMYIEVGGHASGTGNSGICHVGWEKQASGTNYPITAAQGSFSLTGQSAGLLAALKLTAAQGSFALTGQAAGFISSRVLAAGQGSFALTGQDVTLTYAPYGDFSMSAEMGSYALTGEESYADIGMNAVQGSYALTGQDVGFTLQNPFAYSLTAAVGSFILTGRNARLVWSGAPLVPNRQAGIYMGMRIGL